MGRTAITAKSKMIVTKQNFVNRLMIWLHSSRSGGLEGAILEESISRRRITQFSFDLPYSVRAVREFIAGGQSLRRNVNAETDRAFCLALKSKRKSSRWQNLENAMSRDFYRRAA